MENDLSDRVKKILSARKVQKGRIESNILGEALQKEQIEKEQKPVVEALEQQLAQLRQIEQAQQMGNQFQQQVAPLLQQVGDNIQQLQIGDREAGCQRPLHGPQHVPEQAARATSDKGQMIQEMFANYRRGRESRLSTNEINQQGQIGEHGKVDWPSLLNEGRMVLKVGKHTVKTIDPIDMTVGLAALLTLPARDIEKSGITVTDEDKREYFNVMNLAGFKPSSSVKYRILKEWKDLIPEEEEEEFFAAPSSPEQRPKRSATTKLKPKTGKGLFVYKTPGELQEKLALIVGSIRAGNTSSELRNDMRAILDEMLENNYIDHKIHEKFYNKFRLL